MTVAAAAVLIVLPAAASAAPDCSLTTPQRAWAGSARILQVTCAPTVPGAPMTYTIVTNGSRGTATTPDATGAFTFTAGAATGADQVILDASDGAVTRHTVAIDVVAAPVLAVTINAPGLVFAPPFHGIPGFSVFYRRRTTLSASLLDDALPVVGVRVRFAGLPPDAVERTTDAAGRATRVGRPLVSELIDVDVPTIGGTTGSQAYLWVAPDWRVAQPFPIRRGRYQITGQLLAERVARSTGTVRLRRRAKRAGACTGGGYITLRTLALTSKLAFTTTLPRRYGDQCVRLTYSPAADSPYIASMFTFAIG